MCFIHSFKSEGKLYTLAKQRIFFYEPYKQQFKNIYLQMMIALAIIYQKNVHMFFLSINNDI